MPSFIASSANGNGGLEQGGGLGPLPALGGQWRLERGYVRVELGDPKPGLYLSSGTGSRGLRGL